MKNSRLIAAVLSLCAISACKARNMNTDSGLASLSNGDSPASDDTPITAGDRSSIVAAMREARERGMKSVGLDPSKPADVTTYQTQRVEACLANDVGRWSDLMIHYYCQHGVVRQCFTGQAQASAGQFTDNKAHYEATYKFCADKGTNNTDAEWAWLISDQNRANTFKYVMMTNGRSAFNGKPEAFVQADQDAVINEFYGVVNPTVASDCHKRPRRNAKQEPDPTDQHCGTGGGGQAPSQNQNPTPNQNQNQNQTPNQGASQPVANNQNNNNNAPAANNPAANPTANQPLPNQTVSNPTAVVPTATSIPPAAQLNPPPVNQIPSLAQVLAAIAAGQAQGPAVGLQPVQNMNAPSAPTATSGGNTGVGGQSLTPSLVSHPSFQALSPQIQQILKARKPVNVTPGTYSLFQQSAGSNSLQATNCQAQVGNVSNTSQNRDTSAFQMIFGQNCGKAAGTALPISGCASGICPYRFAPWRTVEMVLGTQPSGKLPGFNLDARQDLVTGEGLVARQFTIATEPQSVWVYEEANGQAAAFIPPAEGCWINKDLRTCHNAPKCAWSKKLNRCMPQPQECRDSVDQEWCASKLTCTWQSERCVNIK